MANRYWVGGSATWDSTAGSKWALTSGGAGGQAVPMMVFVFRIPLPPKEFMMFCYCTFIHIIVALLVYLF